MVGLCVWGDKIMTKLLYGTFKWAQHVGAAAPFFFHFLSLHLKSKGNMVENRLFCLIGKINTDNQIKSFPYTK